MKHSIVKNTTCYFRQIPEATPDITASVQPLTINLKNYPSKTNKTCGTRWYKYEPISGRSVRDLYTRAYLHSFCANTVCNSEDFPEAMDDRDGWREKIKKIRAVSETCWRWDGRASTFHTSETLHRVSFIIDVSNTYVEIMVKNIRSHGYLGSILWQVIIMHTCSLYQYC